LSRIGIKWDLRDKVTEDMKDIEVKWDLQDVTEDTEGIEVGSAG
jgi:hypothetical protein